MEKLEVMMEEYKALRDEVVRTPSQRLQILSLGMASAAVLFAAAMNAISVGHAHFLPGLVLLLVVPVVCWASLDSWIAEATRGRRASFYLRGIEREVNQVLGQRALAWEEELRRRDDPQMYMFRGHYWYVWIVFTITAAVSAAVGGYHVASALPLKFLCSQRIWRISGVTVPFLTVSLGSAVLYVRALRGFKLWDEESPHWPDAISRPERSRGPDKDQSEGRAVGNREPESPERVSLDARFNCASNEAVTRVIARDNALRTYLLIAGSLLGVAFGSSSLRPLALVIPYLALIVSLVQCHHDYVIGVLTRYLSSLGGGSSNPHNWHGRKDLLGRALKAGWFHTAAVSVAVLFTAIPAILISKPAPLAISLLGILWVVSWFMLAIAILLLVVLRIFREYQRPTLG